MPRDDLQDRYESDEFWKVVKFARKLILPNPHDVKGKQTFIIKTGTGLILKFRKFFFTYKAKTLMGIKEMDCIWMFDTIIDSDELDEEIDIDKSKS